MSSEAKISQDDLESFKKYQSDYNLLVKLAELQKRNAQLEQQIIIQDLYLKYKLDPKKQSINLLTGEITTKEENETKDG